MATYVVPGFTLLEALRGRGTVRTFVAREDRTGRTLDLSVLRLAGAAEEAEERQRRFLEEGRAVLGVEHPHLVKVLDVGSGPGTAWICQEHVEGLALDEVLACCGGRLSVPEVLAVGVHVGEALACLSASEREFVHRDVRPGTILIGPDGRARLTGFGALSESSYERLHQGDVPQGEVDFLSPEQVEGDLSPTPRTDVYGLGATLYRCLCGRPPHGGTTLFARLRAIVQGSPPDLREVFPGAPEDLAEFLSRCLEWDADDRPLVRDVAPLLRRLACGEGLAGAWDTEALSALYARASAQSAPPFAAGAVRVVLRGAERSVELRLAREEEAEIGRSPQAAVCLPFGWVSRQHARLRWDGERLWLFDLGSANGTKRNGERVEGAVSVRPGDVLSFGDSVFEVDFEADADASSARCVVCGRSLTSDEVHEGGVASCAACRAQNAAERTAGDVRARAVLEEARFEVCEALPARAPLHRYRVRRRARSFLATVVDVGEKAARRIVAESQGALAVKTPGALPAVDLEARGGFVVVVSDAPEGQSLAEWVASAGPLPVREGLLLGQLLCEVCEEFAARGERATLSPDAVFLATDGQPRLLDVGLSPTLEAALRAAPGASTEPCFRAPEVEREGDPGSAAGVYEVAGIVFYALRGTPPAERVGGRRRERGFVGEASGLPTAVRDLLARALASEAERSPRSLPALADAFAELAEALMGGVGEDDAAADDLLGRGGQAEG
ncbi:MAG: FHA domain-containing protein [Planctomycetota bacterium]|nr:MAG: FHA domain-containing protein [Planctomycetota bacterium]